MRAAGLSALAGLLATAHATQCNIEHPISGSTFDLTQELHEAVNGPIEELCEKGFEDSEGMLSFNAGETTFRITKNFEEAKLTTERCNAAFNAIIAECVAKDNVWGGDLDSEGLLYDIHHTQLRQRDIDNIGVYSDYEDDENFDFEQFGELNGRDELDHEGDLDGLRELTLEEGDFEDIEVRSPKGSKPKSKPKPEPKPEPKPTKPKPNPVNPAPVPSKPSKPQQSKPAKAKPATPCLTLVKQVEAENARLAPKSVDVGEEHVGGMALLAKRTTPKSALGCGMTLDADNYPSRNEMPNNARVYGYAQPNQCANMQWVSTPGARRLPNTAYDVEHVLEWNVVTKFFDWLNENHFRGRRFNNPNPRQLSNKQTGARAQVNFCALWKDQWNVPAFVLQNGPARTPFKHIAAKFPSATYARDEFVWLQRVINSVPKANMWARKSTPGIFSETTMNTRLNGNNVDLARRAVLSLKYLLGAQKYMKNPTVAGLLATQKNRIGTVLGQLDTAMPNHRRVVRGQQLDAWNPIGLHRLWNTYMNQKFDTAVQRTRHTMDTYVARAEQRWVRQPRPNDAAHNELKGAIRAVARQWRAERNNWNRPARW